MRIVTAEPTPSRAGTFTVAHGGAAPGARVTADLLDGPGIVVVLAGRGSVVLDGATYTLRPGDVLEHRQLSRHPLRADDAGALQFLELAWQGCPPGVAPRVLTTAMSDFEPAFGIDMASIGDGLAYGRVAAGTETTPHHHDETEALVVVAGRGVLIVNNAAHPVAPGTVVLVDPFEDHVLRNTGDVDLLFVDVYRRDAKGAAAAARRPGAARFGARPVFVFSTPPTPNGDLHLGHLSGPYLGADVFRRFQRMHGVNAYHLTGSDDFQSYVVGRARQDCTTPQQVAAHFAAEIRATLALMDIPVDEFYLTSDAPGYTDGLRAYFSRLVASAGVTPTKAPALVDARTGEYLYEGDVHGSCPSCAARTGGNICEECGEPNLCVDIGAPMSNRPDVTIETAEVERFSLPLHDFRDVVLDHHRRGKVAPRLADLARRVFDRGEFHLPVSHPSDWGVPPAEPVAGDQVIWVWPEMAYGFLHGIGELGRRLGKNWSADRPSDDWKIIHFFGYDNSFYHTILYPILYRLAYPEWTPDIEYNVNEFLLLDGQKFSTSRRHAIWGKEILSPDSVDAVRYYLALTRSERERTDFRLDDFVRANDETLVGVWQHWLDDLGLLVTRQFAGHAPDAGAWTPVQSAFLGRLQLRLDMIALHLDADGFALSDAVHEINELVTDTVRFAHAHRPLADDPARYDEWRTAVALELAAARLLAAVTAPIMPRFAQRLAARLGQSVMDSWPDVVTLVPPGSGIDLAGTVFFTPAAPAQLPEPVGAATR
jgi:methionyl-tRNA synthetase